MSSRKGFNCMSHLEALDQPIVGPASQNFHALASGIGIPIMTDPLSSSRSMSVTVQHVSLYHPRCDDPQSAPQIDAGHIQAEYALTASARHFQMLRNRSEEHTSELQSQS